MRLDFSKAVLRSLGRRPYKHLYINVARMNDGAWIVCWDKRYLGSKRLADAQRLRSLWLADLRGKHPKTGKPILRFWNTRRIRTIRVF
jgi:hypothetical protein